jgi:hypothetical protein
VSLWKRVEQALWTGRVAKDYGVVSEGKHGAATRTVSALLAHRDNQDRFVIKASYKTFFSASVQYMDLDREGALRLKAALDDALQTMKVAP